MSPLISRLIRYTLLILVATVSFWFSPAPLTEHEYCGTYLHLNSFAGFTANCDGFEFMESARYPSRLLAPRAVRQSRPLYVLLGTSVGYPASWALRGLEAGGLLPSAVVAKLPAKYQPLLGFYIGYVLLNFGLLLGAMLLLRHLYYRLTAGRGQPLVLAALLVFPVSNQVTKAFFWTVHQQMFTLLVPLALLWLALQLRERARWRTALPILALLGGGLALLYGSFVLVLPVLLYGLWLKRPETSTPKLLEQALGLIILFTLPTLLWIGLLKLRGVAYYNHEAETYQQLVWLRGLWQQPLPSFLTQVGANLARFGATLPAIAPFLAATLVAGWWLRTAKPRQPPVPIELPGLLGLLGGFLAALGYYQERLTFALVPLLLLVVALALARRPPGRCGTVLLLAAALGWHVWQVLSYGPFS
ncbi:hypothetical protein [Hymenobacter psychrophilus]|uniref:Glycosyltransferase RgtA/B/C/D-like domain-containing protein n=1 Tax=Hymenobacter psychrophilus TaxID=651662 RepID=A0A1H3EM82_9BACT|nr:hypothetical protein [Hymenobacter psychrophilus]SDX79705.1 hypothetical protein SAMN04488069_103210 [Hymenobacter psychrophilus]